MKQEVGIFSETVKKKKDYVRLGKGKIEEKSCMCLANLDRQTQKKAGISMKVTGRRSGVEKHVGYGW